MAWSASGRMTLSEWLDRWLEQMESVLRPGTINHYRRDMEHHVTPYLGQKRLTQITPADLRKLYDTLKQHGRVHPRPGQSRGLSTTTVHGIHTITDMHRKAAEIVGALLTDYLGEEIAPWQSAETAATAAST